MFNDLTCVIRCLGKNLTRQYFWMQASLNEVFAFLSKPTGCCQMPIHLSNLRDHFQIVNCKTIVAPNDRSMLLSQFEKVVIINVQYLDWIWKGNSSCGWRNTRSNHSYSCNISKKVLIIIFPRALHEFILQILEVIPARMEMNVDHPQEVIQTCWLHSKATVVCPLSKHWWSCSKDSGMIPRLVWKCYWVKCNPINQKWTWGESDQLRSEEGIRSNANQCNAFVESGAD